MARLTTSIALAVLSLLAACAATSDGRWNLDDRGVALGGYDPVSYHVPTGPQPGELHLTATHEGATYRFANEESRVRFLNSPKYYLPRYGGWCAYAMAEGEKVGVDPTCYLLTDEGLYLFYRSVLIDTKERWERAGHQELKRAADQEWAALEEERARLRAVGR